MENLQENIIFESDNKFVPYKTTLDKNGTAKTYYEFPDYWHKDSAETFDYFAEFTGHYKILNISQNIYKIEIIFNKVKTNHWSDKEFEKDIYCKILIEGKLDQLQLDYSQLNDLKNSL